MSWKKLGNVFCPNNNFPWMVSHASSPFAEWLQNGMVKIYFNCRNANQQSHVGYVIIDMNDNFKVKEISETPVLSPGQIGLFDDSGISMAQVIKFNNKKLLYYLGWNLKVTVPWQNSIGVAIYNENEKVFKKYSQAPVMDRSAEDPFSISYPFVLEEDKKLKMWYGSNLSWGKKETDMLHVIKYAESADGINWDRHNEIAIDLKEGEFAVSRPFVIKENGIYKMWYSYRNAMNEGHYRIGFATSSDGKNWLRKDDEAQINISLAGWDNEMVCYASILVFNHTKYMFYNGNNYGKTGFGVAVWED